MTTHTPDESTQDAKLDELLPCPFCGDAAVVRDDEEGGFYVACTSLECYATLGEGYDRDAMPDHSFGSEEEAATAWNRRSELRAPKATADAAEPDVATWEEWEQAAKRFAAAWAAYGRLFHEAERNLVKQRERAIAECKTARTNMDALYRRALSAREVPLASASTRSGSESGAGSLKQGAEGDGNTSTASSAHRDAIAESVRRSLDVPFI